MADDWVQRQFPAGTAVEVQGLDGTLLGVGQLVNPFDADDDSDDWEIPQIKMLDGRIIEGSECWWIPVSETRQRGDRRT